MYITIVCISSMHSLETILTYDVASTCNKQTIQNIQCHMNELHHA